MTDRSTEEGAAGEGTLTSHILELRDRLIKALGAVLLLALPCIAFSNELFTLVAQPLIQQLPPGSSLIATSVVSPFMAPFKLALYVALFLAMPVVLYQLWAFVAPGLYRHERRFAAPLVLSSILLFYAGVAFAYFVVFPLMFQFFAATTPSGVTMMTDITQYLDFVLILFFCFGLAFEIPIAVVLLTQTGLVKVAKLAEARGYVLIGIFVVAAILTPPDAVSQVAMALPMWILYEAGIIMSRLMLRVRRPAEREDDPEESAA
ncbi:MAG: twin-arginine translocase subunit TatC [Gammaproteobacteria bacterium]